MSNLRHQSLLLVQNKVEEKQSCFVLFYSLSLAYKLKTQVYEAGKNDRLVYVDCDASFPSEIANLDIHPIIVYIQVSRLQVLQKLIRETCRDSKQREELLRAAYQLYDLPPDQFSLVLTDSNIEDASQNLELFVESYWASTHPPLAEE